MSARRAKGAGWHINGVSGVCPTRDRFGMARAEGIVLGPTPQGKRPIYQSDMARWIELGAIDTRTAEEIASDAEYDRRHPVEDA